MPEDEFPIKNVQFFNIHIKSSCSIVLKILKFFDFFPNFLSSVIIPS